MNYNTHLYVYICIFECTSTHIKITLKHNKSWLSCKNMCTSVLYIYNNSQ
jgi:hypothetical protein